MCSEASRQTLHWYIAFVVSAQQQSRETCTAIDTMIAGADPLLGTCTRNEECLEISCMTASGTTTLTILPCRDPIVVRVILTGTSGTFNQDLTMGTEVPISLGSIVVELEQTQEGITFGVSTTWSIGLASNYCFPDRLFLEHPSSVTQSYSPQHRFHWSVHLVSARIRTPEKWLFVKYRLRS